MGTCFLEKNRCKMHEPTVCRATDEVNAMQKELFWRKIRRHFLEL
jgi:hypothetical protein